MIAGGAITSCAKRSNGGSGASQALAFRYNRTMDVDSVDASYSLDSTTEDNSGCWLPPAIAGRLWSDQTTAVMTTIRRLLR